MKGLLRMLKSRMMLIQKIGAGLFASFLMLVLCVSNVHSMQFDTGNPDWSIRLDNTAKYSTSYRLHSQSRRLISDANQDDGNRAFDVGFISNRFDLLTEFDIVFKRNFGARISTAMWYDSVYLDDNDNNSPATANIAFGDHDHFTDDTEELHGKDAEILDAFVFANTYFGDTGVNFRLGQFAMQWGETFFFGSNGIAGGMAPVDIIKLLSVPSSQFKEILRPVKQVFTQFQFESGLTIGAYYQFEWEKSRLPAADSYFGNGDVLDVGGESLLAVPGILTFYRGEDQHAKDSGQGGLQVRFPVGNFDLGLYAIRYHEKTPQVYLYPITHYEAVYPEGIEAYGASASTSHDIVNLATEVSFRRNTPLVSDGATLAPGGADNDKNPAYAVGNTLHAVVSAFILPGQTFISQESTLIAELAWNRRIRTTSNPEMLSPRANRNAVGFRCIFEPAYRQVLPGVDMIVNLGLSYFPEGRSSCVFPFGPDKGGDYTIGVTTTYLDVWRCKLAYTRNYGSTDLNQDATIGNPHFNMKQSYADRDFISFSIYRTF